MITKEVVLALTNHSVMRWILIVVVLTLTTVFARIVSKILKGSLDRHSSFLKVDHTQFVIFRHFVTGMIYLVGFGVVIYMIPSLRALSVSLLASAGVLAVVLGLASQKAFSNIISGIFIAIFKPFRVGDIIKFEDKRGTVEDITLRHTVVRNFENKRFIVPNSIISDEIIENYNISDESICVFIEFDISYDSDLKKALKIMEKEALKHPNTIDPNKNKDKSNKSYKPKIQTKVIGFGDSSVKLRAWVWAKNPNSGYHLKWDLNQSIKLRFDKEGIEIPYPYRTLVYKKDMKKK